MLPGTTEQVFCWRLKIWKEIPENNRPGDEAFMRAVQGLRAYQPVSLTLYSDEK